MSDDLNDALEGLGALREPLAGRLGCAPEAIPAANAANAKDIWAWTCHAMLTGVRDAPLMHLRYILAREFPSVIE